jgi:hypothetical protein
MGDGLERIPLAKAADMILERFKSMQPHEILQWKNVNRVPFNEFWARAKTDALGVKREIERIEREINPQ